MPDSYSSTVSASKSLSKHPILHFILLFKSINGSRPVIIFIAVVVFPFKASINLTLPLVALSRFWLILAFIGPVGVFKCFAENFINSDSNSRFSWLYKLIKVLFPDVKYGYNWRFALLGRTFKFSITSYSVGLKILLVDIDVKIWFRLSSTLPGSTFGRSFKVWTV